MLFARFLAENDLLLDADHGMAMSLDEVRELAREQNRDWLEVAAELAQKMLLAVFRPDDPALRVSLPPETRQQMELKLASLPAEVFRADDGLGWVYQFWQRDEKDRVNKSEVKIGADELPAVTQLFTEDYMVLFLLENTLGSWWTAKRNAEGKDPALPGYEWTYLRLNEDGSPAAGSFDAWPRAARDLRVLDPCMGSGHFLTFALQVLARMRVVEEGLTLQKAVIATLRDNLYGLELDARCSQIAAFNLALAAWRLIGEHLELPSLNLACSGLGINATESDWLKLAGEDGFAREEMRRIYSLFADAPKLGSLIDPLRLSATVYSAGADRVLPLIEEALQCEKGDDARELAIAAHGVVAAFRILSSQFTLVATNVPYLGRAKQDAVLAKYCAEFHSDAKADLATCFVDRCLRLCSKGGSTAVVTPQNWLFLTSYTKVRERLLKLEQWDFVARLGEHAFDSQAAAGAFAALLGLTSRRPAPEHTFAAWDVIEAKTPEAKAAGLAVLTNSTELQGSQLKNPDFRIASGSDQNTFLLQRVTECYQGLRTGDRDRFIKSFWEVPGDSGDWEPFRNSSDSPNPCDGISEVIFWEFGTGSLHEYAKATRDKLHDMHESGNRAWGKHGVAINQMRKLKASLYWGEKYDGNVNVIFPSDPELLPAVWCYTSSPEYERAVRRIDQKLNVTNATLVKVPFDVAHWGRVAAEKYPDGLPKPHSHNPTQWMASGHPKDSDHPLQVAIARLVGYAWPRQTGSSFPDCPALGSDSVESHADADGIVPLNALAGEAGAVDRVRLLLADAYGEEWSAAKLRELLGGCESLETWVRDRFFDEHCQIFDQRPFVWHVWDGRKDGFHVLVNYHRLAAPNGEGHKTLEKLIYTYLGRWIERQADEVKAGKEGADARLAAAVHLKTELEKILGGEKPYDIFIRWKPLHLQALGWNPDINDGVRLNIRPWLTAQPHQPSRRDSCILRITPRMNYGKDRGKEPHRPMEDFPWFWSWDEQSDDFLGGKDFEGTRWNDLHYSLETKRQANERKRKAGA